MRVLLDGDVRAAIAGQGFEELPIDVSDAERDGRLTGPTAILSTACSSPRRLRTSWQSSRTRERSTTTGSAGSGEGGTLSVHAAALTYSVLPSRKTFGITCQGLDL